MIDDIKKRAPHRTAIIVTDTYEAGGDQREVAVTELVRSFERSDDRG